MPERATTDERSAEKAGKPWHTPELRDLGSVEEVTATTPTSGGTDANTGYTTG